MRLDVGADGRAGFHRYHSAELVTDLRCGQLPDGMLDGLGGPRWQAGEQVHVVLDDDGARHVVATSRQPRRTRVIEGANDTVQRVGRRAWRVPSTGFWQAHRAAAATYSALVAEWTRDSGAATAWDLYGGAGVFAAALAEVVGGGGRVLTVDTSRAASRSARAALADLPQVEVVTESVRRALHGAAGRRATSRCSIRRAPGPDARWSNCWPPPGCRGWSTSVARPRRSPATSGCTSARLPRRADPGLRLVPADPSRRMRRAGDEVR